jgi:LuxR family maltose regulon positive regulatory protein
MRVEAATGNGDRVVLAPREKEVLELMAEGFTNQEIAGKLFLSLNTVKFYSTAIYDKLGAKNRANAVKLLLSRA